MSRTWPEISLGQLLDDAPVFVDGDWVESKDQDPNGDVRLIQLADVGDGFYVDKSARFLTSAKARELRCTFLQPGDVLIARMPDPLGRACIFPGDRKPAVTVVDVCIVRPNRDRVDSRWLMHVINSVEFRKNISGFVSGATRQRISRGNLAKLTVSVPPLPEQRRIAAILDKADALRAKRREAITKLDQLLHAVFLDMFGVHRSDDIRCPLSDLAEPTKNSFTNGPFGSDLLAEELVDSGVPVIYIRDIRDGSYARVSGSHVTTEKAEKIKACCVLPGDILISKVGDPPGVAAVYPEFEPPGVVTQDVIRLRPNKERVISEYLWALLNSELGKRLVAPIIVEATRARFSLRDLKALEVPVPSLDRQKKFAAVAFSIQHQATLTSKANLAFNRNFMSLQNRAFNGTL